MSELTESQLLGFIKLKQKVKFYDLKEYFRDYGRYEISKMVLELSEKKLIKFENGYCSIS